MAFTSVTVTGVATFPSGEVCPNAEVTFSLDEPIVNSAATASGGQAFANASGAWSITVDATNDGGTSPANGGYVVTVKDPSSGEELLKTRVPVPNSPTTTTLTALLAGAF